MDELLPWLQQLTFWHWMVLGVALIVIELLLPGIWFLWLGIGGLATGLVILFADQMSWQYQIAIFCAFSVASIFIGRQVMRRARGSEDDPLLNRRAQRYVGQVFSLTEASEQGFSRVKIGDSIWRVRLSTVGVESAMAASVRVTGSNGATLLVEPVENQ
jgi:membrane protein implicated in regulation of membrane protease activity